MIDITTKLREFAEVTNLTGHSICLDAVDAIDGLRKIIDELITGELESV